jgi:hypothetical protein
VSKRLYSTAKWKEYSRRRQLDELRKVRRHRAVEHAAEVGRQTEHSIRKKHRRPFSEIRAPAVFSIVNNPEGLIEIISKTHNITLDLSGVKSLTTDAVAAFLATIQKDEIRSTTRIVGNQPLAPEARDRLIDSGFFSHVTSVQPVAAASKGRMIERKSKKVEPATARDLIHLANDALYGDPRRCPPAYRVLIESMNNTHNHASGRHEYQETWWATVYADVERERACYTFLDTGVGIFRSVKVSKLRRLFKMAGIQSDATILRDVLEGKVESSTGQPFRGKGLPAINDLSKRGRIKSLVIVANDVYGNVEKGEFRPIRTSFSGTLLYWEV